MNINAHNLKPVSNFIAKSSDRGPVLCTEFAPTGGGTLNLYFYSEEEINAVLELILKGRELLQDANRETKKGVE